MKDLDLYLKGILPFPPDFRAIPAPAAVMNHMQKRGREGGHLVLVH